MGLDGRSIGPGDILSKREVRELSSGIDSRMGLMSSRVGLACREPKGEDALIGVLVPNERTEVGVFSGDNDRSRSCRQVSSHHISSRALHTRFTLKAGGPVLQDLSLKPLIAFVIFSLALVAQIPDGLEKGLWIKIRIGHVGDLTRSARVGDRWRVRIDTVISQCVFLASEAAKELAGNREKGEVVAQLDGFVDNGGARC